MAFLRGLMRGVVEDLRLKALALTLALLLFSIVSGARDAQRSFFVEVITLLPPPSSERVLMTQLPDRVRVTLRGSRSVLNSVLRRGIDPVQVDLRQGDLRYFYFDPDDFGFPAGLSVVQVNPATVPLVWARRIERRLKVAPQIIDHAALGLVLSETIAVTPQEIALRGPEPEVRKMRQVSTEPIAISELGPGRHARVVQLEVPPPNCDYVNGSLVRVSFELTRDLVDREFASVPIKAHHQGKRAPRLRPSRAKLRLEGPRHIMRTIRRQDIRLFVDAATLNAGETRQLRIQTAGLPKGLTSVSTDPSEIQARGR